MKFFRLLYLLTTNTLYNFVLFWREFWVFRKCSWWRKVKFEFFKAYPYQNYYQTPQKLPLVTEQNSRNFIYGETPCLTVSRMLSRIEYSPGDHFIDLGCGRGLTLFYAHFLGKLQCTGYDLVPDFIRKANKIKENLNLKNVYFINKNLLDADLSSASIIYIAGTTFTDDQVNRLTETLARAPCGCKVITLSYDLKDERFELKEEFKSWFSWGSSHVLIHERRSE